MIITDFREGSDPDYTGDWTYGTGGRQGRFGGAHPDGLLHLHSWADGLVTRRVKCSTYRIVEKR